MADTIPGDITTTETLVLDQFAYGEVETVGDEDWFRIELEAGKNYLFEIVGQSTSPYTLDFADVQIFDESGEFTLGSAGTGRGTGSKAYTVITPSAKGTFFISAQGTELFPEHYLPSAIGTYRLTAVKLVPEVAGYGEDHGDGRAGAVGLAVDDTRYGFSSGDDRDWFRVTVEAGKSSLARLENTAFVSRINLDSRLVLVDAAGEDIARGADGPVSMLSFSAEADGTLYVLQERSDGNTYYEQGFYALALTELPSLFFTAGDDWLSLPADVPTRLLDIRGGAGGDTMSFAGLAAAVEVNLATGLARAGGAEAFSRIMDSVEHVSGTGLGDTVWGSAGADRVRGLGGNDRVFGSAGGDRLEGGAGRDTVDYGTAAAGISASLLRGRGWGGDAAGDRFVGIEALTGSRLADVLWGDHGANRLEGGAGDDTITGNGGDDYILAGLGTDVVVFAGNRAEYTVTTAGIRTDVTDSLGRDGHDILAHAELLRFADGDWLV